MKRKLSVLALMIPLVLVACLQPGDTPLGPEHPDIDIPDSLLLTTVVGVDSVWSSAEAIPLFESTMLFCGADSATGFRAEPLWVFSIAPLTEATESITEAMLQLNFATSGDSANDNPDLGRDVMVQLWRLGETPSTGEALEALDLDNAWQIPVNGSSEPFRLEVPDGEGFSLPTDSVQEWIANVDTVALALKYMDDSEWGMIRLYSRGSVAGADDDTAAILKIRYFDQEELGLSSACHLDGMAVSQDSPLDLDQRLVLSTGLPRGATVLLSLPDSLLDPAWLIVRARLMLYPDPASVFGTSPADGNNGQEGGLTLELTAAGADGFGMETDPPSEILEDDISLFGWSDSVTTPVSPLILPLTIWVEDLAASDPLSAPEHLRLDLQLNGEGERIRSIEFFLPGELGDQDLRPRLEILHARRPDFD